MCVATFIPGLLLCIGVFGIYISLTNFGYSHFGPIGINHCFPSGVNSPFFGFVLLVLFCSSLAGFLPLGNHGICGVVVVILWICGVSYLLQMLSRWNLDLV
jgi:hypothetical protein